MQHLQNDRIKFYFSGYFAKPSISNKTGGHFMEGVGYCMLSTAMIFYHCSRWVQFKPASTTAVSEPTSAEPAGRLLETATFTGTTTRNKKASRRVCRYHRPANWILLHYSDRNCQAGSSGWYGEVSKEEYPNATVNMKLWQWITLRVNQTEILHGWARYLFLDSQNLYELIDNGLIKDLSIEDFCQQIIWELYQLCIYTYNGVIYMA